MHNSKINLTPDLTKLTLTVAATWSQGFFIFVIR